MLDEIATLIAVGPIAVARVISTSGAGPRGVGATMLITTDGRPIGSLSAGCVEAAVIETALHVIDTGESAIEHFGYAADDAIAIGLTCGGEVEVFVERFDRSSSEVIAELVEARETGRPVALLTGLQAVPRRRVQTADPAPQPDMLDADARALLTAGVSGVIGTDECETPDHAPRQRTFVHTFAAPPRMILAGANDFVRAMAAAAGPLGYRVTVVDARPVFATRARFPQADDVVVDWPHRYLRAEQEAGRIDGRTAVCVMTHDTKFDVPVLAAALAMHVGFVGALGSRRTHADRLTRLRETGVTDAQLERLNSPVGLDIGAHSPEETAVSILAQIIADRGPSSGGALRDLDGPIHR
ncbi:XdhC family protein [Williamsia sterculiae]